MSSLYYSPGLRPLSFLIYSLDPQPTAPFAKTREKGRDETVPRTPFLRPSVWSFPRDLGRTVDDPVDPVGLHVSYGRTLLSLAVSSETRTRDMCSDRVKLRVQIREETVGGRETGAPVDGW